MVVVVIIAIAISVVHARTPKASRPDAITPRVQATPWPKPASAPTIEGVWTAKVDRAALIQTLHEDQFYLANLTNLALKEAAVLAGTLGRTPRLQLRLTLHRNECQLTVAALPRYRAVPLPAGAKPHGDARGNSMLVETSPPRVLDAGPCQISTATHWNPGTDSWTGGQIAVHHNPVTAAGTHNRFTVWLGHLPHRTYIYGSTQVLRPKLLQISEPPKEISSRTPDSLRLRNVLIQALYTSINFHRQPPSGF